MKKTALWGIMALCLGFVACDEVDEDSAAPQAYPQLPGFNANELVVSTPAEKVVVDLQNLVDINAEAIIADYVAPNFPFTEYDLQFVMQICRDASFSNIGELPAYVNSEGKVYVSAADLQSVYYVSISKDPSARDINVRYAAYAVNGSSKIRLGGTDKYYGEGVINVTPCPSGLFYSSAYYLLIEGQDPIKLDHSSESVYDDQIFYKPIVITADQANDGLRWKVISQEAINNGYNTPNSVFGQENDDEDYLEGYLFGNTADFTPGWGVIYEEGPHMFTIDVSSLYYTIQLTIENLYTPGNANGWNPAGSQTLTTTNYNDYYGFAHLGGDFKFTSQPDWNGINYGNSGVAGTLSTDSGAGNLNAATDGLYWCHVVLAALKYDITLIESVGVIGDFNSWSAQVNLTPSADFNTWTGKVDLTPGGWKFRMNDNWDINLGGDLNDLTVGGANIDVTEAGTYTITLNVATRPYTATITK